MAMSELDIPHEKSPEMMDKHPISTAALLRSLRALRKANPKAVRPSVHLYPASIYENKSDPARDVAESSKTAQARDRRITSWKMTEHMYFNKNNLFPTLARGLFTEVVEGGEGVPPEAEQYEGEWEKDEQRERIVARGYDKFFNIDEVGWTNWKLMRNHTVPPYYLTLKSNGCLILISALSPTHLLVASKHSLGTTTEAEAKQTRRKSSDGVLVDDMKAVKIDDKGKNKATEKNVAAATDEDKEAQSHAEVGRQWLKRTLKRSGQSEEELARRLWDQNLTAVLELCDDSFEEHVIATPEHWTGLHLHGLNHNTPHFATVPPTKVTEFAHEFGFIPTKYVEVESIEKVKEFTDNVAQTGAWEGDMIEGFVVRSTVADNPTSEGKPPYRPGAPYFFKVKFDEPYLLYRQWREVTRVLLPLLDKPNEQQTSDIWDKVRKKNKRAEVGLYADWAAGMMKTEPKLFDNYDKGVVRVRERFLAWVEKEGAQAWKAAQAGNYKMKGISKGKQKEPEVSKDGLPKKYVIVPVAVPGCGKTMVGVALSRLFGFGHTQSDDVTSKKTGPTFLANIAGLLKNKEVVFADRNNHIDKHYKELSELGQKKDLKNVNVRLIGVVWDVESEPYHRLLRVCSERVVKRGDNHQTLRPDLTLEAEHEAVVGNFLRNWTSPDPEIFEKLITVNIPDPISVTFRTIVESLCQTLDIPLPRDEKIEQALKDAEAYKVTTPYRAPAVKIGKKVRYFGVAPEIDLKSTVLSIFDTRSDNEAQSMFENMQKDSRVTTKPHITLVHENSVASEKEAAGEAEAEATGPVQGLWGTCRGLAESTLSPIYEFDMPYLVWDGRVMALMVDNLHPRTITPGPTDKKDGEAGTAKAPELIISDELSVFLHVTVGTKSEATNAFEARALVKAARQAIASGTKESSTDEIAEGGGRVKWLKLDNVKGEGRIRGMY